MIHGLVTLHGGVAVFQTQTHTHKHTHTHTLFYDATERFDVQRDICLSKALAKHAAIRYHSLCDDTGHTHTHTHTFTGRQSVLSGLHALCKPELWSLVVPFYVSTISTVVWQGSQFE